MYPDARLVLLHRDPVVLVRVGVQPDQHAVGARSPTPTTARTSPTHWPAMLEESVRRIDAFRAAHPEHPIVDVQYADLVDRSAPRPWRRSTRAVRRRARRRGREADRRVRRRPPASGEFGAHRYDVAEFGLDAGELAERFAGYVDRYAIPREHA